MAMASDILNAQGGLLRRLDAVLAWIKDARAKRKIYVQTRDELLSLSDADLADIGVNRSMVYRIAYEAAYGKK